MVIKVNIIDTKNVEILFFTNGLQRVSSFVETRGDAETLVDFFNRLRTKVTNQSATLDQVITAIEGEGWELL